MLLLITVVYRFGSIKDGGMSETEEYQTKAAEVSEAAWATARAVGDEPLHLLASQLQVGQTELFSLLGYVPFSVAEPARIPISELCGCAEQVAECCLGWALAISTHLEAFSIHFVFPLAFSRWASLRMPLCSRFPPALLFMFSNKRVVLLLPSPGQETDLTHRLSNTAIPREGQF